MEDTDANQDALRQVENATSSSPVGEDEELFEYRKGGAHFGADALAEIP